VSPKAERGRALRQSILSRLNRVGMNTLPELALALQAPRQVVLGHLNMMVTAGEVARVWPNLYNPLVRKTKVFVHGGAVKKRVINRCTHKAAIKNQGGQGASAPRQTTHARISGL